jgi:predicted transcriptional regulator
MMNPPASTSLTRRERQLMEILYRLESATVSDVMEALPDAPSYSTVRALLGRLVSKGAAHYKVDGPRYVYAPARPVTRERISAIKHVVNTFFGGSRVDAVAALFDKQSSALSEEELERLAQLVKDARRRGA